MKQYRVHFLTDFKLVVNADSIEQARITAQNLAQTWRELVADGAEETQCVWNTIEPLDGGPQ